MAYFHSRNPKSPGGKPKWKVVGDTIEELLTLTRERPEVGLTIPPRKQLPLSGKKQVIYCLVPFERHDILDEIGSTEVSDEHVSVMSMILRRELWESRYGLTDDQAKWFEVEVRGKVITLLSRGEWVDEPSSLGLELWNESIRKLDLGRRSDLKFSSRQSERVKYNAFDKDAQRDDVEDEDLWVRAYRNSSPEERRIQWAEFAKDISEGGAPWRLNQLRDLFGEP